jgi:hypothetical protein
MLLPFQWSLLMQSNEFYYLLAVCGVFGAFSLAMAISYIQYRRWLKQPTSRRSMAESSLSASTSSLSMSPSNSLSSHALVAGRKPQKPST